MSELKLQLPSDFEPTKLRSVQIEGEWPEVSYWIYKEDGTSISYTDATQKDVTRWIQELYPRALDMMPAPEYLTTSATKSVALDTVLELAHIRATKLFGGPEWWDKIEEWKRLKRLEEKQRKQRNDEGEKE